MKKEAIIPEKIDKLITELDNVKRCFRTITYDSGLLNLESALNFLSEMGYQISKSSIYKLTSSHSIPVKRFGKKLLFDKIELKKWCFDHTVEQTPLGLLSQNLSMIANRKLRNGKSTK